MKVTTRAKRTTILARILVFTFVFAIAFLYMQHMALGNGDGVVSSKITRFTAGYDQPSEPPRKKTVTMVTALYVAKNKHGKDISKYFLWWEYLIRYINAAPLFVYVDSENTKEELKKRITHTARTQNITFIIMPLNQTDTYNYLTESQWEEQQKIDPENNIHSDYKLYILWLAKVEFLRRSMQLSSTDFYFWTDIGTLRHRGGYSIRYCSKCVVEEKRVATNLPPVFPMVELLERYCTNRICLNTVEPAFLEREDPIRGKVKNNMAGAQLVFLKQDVGFFEIELRNMILGLAKTHFIGKDQNLYSWMVKQNKKRYVLYAPRGFLEKELGAYDFFYFMALFANTTTPLIIYPEKWPQVG